MAFHENAVFPEEISFGSVGGPGYDVKVITLDSGAEQRVSRHEQAIHKYDASFGIKTYDDMAEVLTFFHARLGATYGFRWKDWNDYTTAANHKDAPAATDQPLGVSDGTSNQVFPMYKQYTDAGVTRNRQLEKIKAGTTVVAYDGVAQLSGWTVNTATGEITIGVSPPVNGTVITYGCQFYVPARFDLTAGENLPISIDAFDMASLSSIPVVEIRNENTIQDEFFFGGALELAISADYTLAISQGRLVSLEATTTGLAARLPDPTDLPPGGPYWFIVNTGSNAFAIKTHDGTTIVATVAAGEGGIAWLSLSSLGAKVWYVR